MLANQIRPTTNPAAIVFRVHPFLAKKHRELSFSAIALNTTMSTTDDARYILDVTTHKDIIYVNTSTVLSSTNYVNFGRICTKFWVLSRPADSTKSTMPS